jgi:hypothetical protein
MKGMKGSKILGLSLFWGFYIFTVWQSYIDYQDATDFSIWVYLLLFMGWFDLVIFSLNVLAIQDSNASDNEFRDYGDYLNKDKKDKSSIFDIIFITPLTIIFFAIGLLIMQISKFADKFLSI